MILSQFIKDYSPNPKGWSQLNEKSFRIIHTRSLPNFDVLKIEFVEKWIPEELGEIVSLGRESEIRATIMRWHLTLNYFRKLHYYKGVSVLHCGYAEFFAKYPKKIPKIWNEYISPGGMIAFPGAVYCSWNQMNPIIRVLERSISNDRWRVAYSNLYWPYSLRNYPMAVFKAK